MSGGADLPIARIGQVIRMPAYGWAGRSTMVGSVITVLSLFLRGPRVCLLVPGGWRGRSWRRAGKADGVVRVGHTGDLRPTQPAWGQGRRSPPGTSRQTLDRLVA